MLGLGERKRSQSRSAHNKHGVGVPQNPAPFLAEPHLSAIGYDKNRRLPEKAEGCACRETSGKSRESTGNGRENTGKSPLSSSGRTRTFSERRRTVPENTEVPSGQTRSLSGSCRTAPAVAHPPSLQRLRRFTRRRSTAASSAASSPPGGANPVRRPRPGEARPGPAG